jgi:hypothetical protein
MAWQDTHSICDLPIAFRAVRSAKMSDVDLALVDADLSSVTVAKAACITGASNIYVGDRFMGINGSRGMQACSDMGGTFSSSFTTLYNSLPDNDNGNKARMINGA